MSNITINTSQNVNLDYKLIGIGERLVAFLIDGLILIGYLFIIESVMTVSDIFDTDDWTKRGVLGLLTLPAFFYSLICHVFFNGQTIGKMIMKIKVVRYDGAPTQWYNLLVRWMLRIIDIWLFFASIGVISILLSDKKQRVGDSAAGTVVIGVREKHRITSTILEEITDDYQPVFNNVSILSDKDVRIIKEAFTISKRMNDFETLTLLRNKICGLLQIESDMFDKELIDTVLKDYNYYTQRM